MAHTLTGTVVSDKRDKTITVAITSRETHPLYKKQYTRTRKYTAHDAKNAAHLGDKVEIKETRPISATKHYELTKILEKSHGKIELKDDSISVVAKVGNPREAILGGSREGDPIEDLSEMGRETADRTQNTSSDEPTFAPKSNRKKQPSTKEPTK